MPIEENEKKSDPEEPARDQERRRGFLERLLENWFTLAVAAEIVSWIQIIVAAIVIALVLNNFVIANSRVPTGSMQNTIMAKSRVIGSRLSYINSDPERGDVVIFHFPDDPTGKIYYVKRIIGLPGETVDIVDGKVYINGSDTPLEEPYLPEPMEEPITDEPYGHYTVPEGCYFMLGDNRNNSLDARFWENKYVAKDKIIAKVLFSYFPKIEKIE